MEYRLCGGTFFQILTRCKFGYSKDITFMGKSLKVSEPYILYGLSMLTGQMPPIKSVDSLRSIASSFKACTLKKSVYVPFGNETAINAYTDLVLSNYPLAMEQMQEFLRSFLNVSDNNAGKDIIAPLNNLIQMDNSIRNDDVFYAHPKGYQIRKSELITSNETFCLPAYLVGVFQFILKNRTENSIGLETVSAWANNTFPVFNKSTPLATLDIPVYGETTENSAPESLYSSTESLTTLQNYFNRTYTLNNVIRPIISETFCPFYDQFVRSHIIYRGKKYPIPDVPSSLFNEKYILITATGGIGKTTLMTHFLLQSLLHYDKTGIIPILIPVRNLHEQYEDLLSFIYSQIRSSLKVTKEVFTDLLSQQNTLLLLDGFDESIARKFSTTISMIEAFTFDFPKVNIIVSSRAIESVNNLKRFYNCKLCNLTYEQAQELIDKITGVSPSLKARFKRAFTNEMFMEHYDIASNPLILPIMVETFDEYGEIPNAPHKFYDYLVRAVVTKHDNRKDFKRLLVSGLPIDHFLSIVREFCYKAYLNNDYSFTFETMQEYLFDMRIYKFLNINPLPANAFATDLLGNLCFMSFNNDDRLVFLHRSFQEYFAALYMASIGDNIVKNSITKYHDDLDNRSDDAAIPMLFCIDRGCAEYAIFWPELQHLFDRVKDDYWSYITETYNEIYFTQGYADEFKKSIPSSAIINHILCCNGILHEEINDSVYIPFDRHRHIYRPMFFVGDSEDAVPLEEMDRIVKKAMEKKKIEIEEINLCDPDFMEFSRDVLNLYYRIAGGLYRINPKELVESNFREDPAIRRFFESPDCPFFIEYVKLEQYYKQLNDDYLNAIIH